MQSQKSGSGDQRRVTRSMSVSSHGAADASKMFTKEEVESLVQNALDHLKDEMSILLNSKLQAINAKQQELEDRVDSLAMDLDLVKENAAKDMHTMQNKVESLQQQCHSLETRLKKTATKANENEQYSRRNNLRFWGVKLNQGETPSDAIVRVVNERLNIKDHDGQRLPLTKHHIEMAHPLPAPQSAKPGDPAPLIVRFYNRNVRDKIISARRNLKSSVPNTKSMAISEDLTVENQKLLTKLNTCEVVNSAWTWGGKVFYTHKRNTKKRLPFAMFEDLPGPVKSSDAADKDQPVSN